MRALPNLFTGIRILLTPVIIYLLLTGRCAIALPVTFFTGLTDAVDGYLARKMGAESEIGAWLDPIADKFLLTSLYVSFSAAGLAPAWLAWLVVGRDILIVGMAGSGLVLKGIRDFPPTVWGKISTVIQIGASLVLLGSCADYHFLAEISEATIWLVAAATAWSGLHYIWYAVGRFRKAQHQV